MRAALSKGLGIVSSTRLTLVIDIRRHWMAVENSGKAVVWVDSHKRRDVAGGNETAARGQVTAANDGMRGASPPLTDRRDSARRRRELHRQRSKLVLQSAGLSTD